MENKKCQKFSKLKTPVEIVPDKLIMFLKGIPTSNEYRPIDHRECTAIKKSTVFLDEIFQKYLLIHCFTMCYVKIVHHLVIKQ